MSGLRLALSFLTVAPVGPRTLPVDLAGARGFFPLVGLGLGGLLALAEYLLRPLYPPLAGAALLVVLLAVLTRGLHLDGLADACDGLFGGGTPARRLEIMRDPRVGAFGVVAVAAVLLLKWASIAALPPGHKLALLVLFPCLARWGILVAMTAFPYARAAGLGAAFHTSGGAASLALGLATALAASLLLAGYAGLLLLGLATAAAWGLGRWMAGLVGGLTGDTYGAVGEVLETLLLIVALGLARGAPSLLHAPLEWTVPLG